MVNIKYQISNIKFFINRIFSVRWQAGFSVIEIILASAIFVIFSSGAISVILQGFEANRLGSEETIASQYASEGLEAARSIKDQAYSNLVVTAGTGVGRNASNVWYFTGSNNQFGPSNKYTRVISISAVQRDGSGNIVVSGGSVDPNTMKVTSTVTWNFTPTRHDSVILSTYLTNWKAPIP